MLYVTRWTQRNKRHKENEHGAQRECSLAGQFERRQRSTFHGERHLKDTQYSFAARFADGVGTNPEELIAAAHAGCFTMAFSGQLTQAGFTADKIETTAKLTLDMHGQAPPLPRFT